MATDDQIQARVLQHLQAQWAQIVPATDFRQDLGLRDQQVLDIGEELAKELGCNPTRTQIVGCHTVKDLIALLIKTKFTAKVATLRSAAKLAAKPYPAVAQPAAPSGAKARAKGKG
jgi:hypothetical protein